MSRQLSTDEMLAVVRAWAVSMYGVPPAVIDLKISNGQTFHFDFPQHGPAQGHAPAATFGGVDDVEVTPCERDCLEVIGLAGKRLTTEQVKKALQDAGYVHGDSTIALALATLTQRKNLLSNHKDAHGKGYGLKEW